MPKVEDSLATALADESQWYFKFLLHARRAEQDLLPQIAKVFRAAAAAKSVHALASVENMGSSGTTLQNLKAAVVAQSHEFEELYPPILQLATQEGHKAKTMLGYAWTVASTSFLRQALEALEAGHDLPEGDVYFCPFCGHIEFGVPTVNCPICGEAPVYYRKIE